MEWKYMRGTGIALVAALALGLAGCGSSSDDDTADAPTVTEPTGPTQAELDAEKARADAAQAELDRLQAAADLKAARELFGVLAEPRATLMANPVTGATIAAVAGRDLNGDGTDDSAITIPAVGRADDMGMASKTVSGVTTTVQTYSTMAPNSGKPFGEVYDISGDGTISFADTADAAAGVESFTNNKKLKSSSFPSESGTRTFRPGNRQFAGTYDGADGQYSCSADAATGCTAMFNSGGGITLAGTWTFDPDDGVSTSVADADFQTYGWWLQKDGTGKIVDAGPVHFVNGGLAVAAATEALQGTATYMGNAAGKYSIYSGAFSDRSHAGHFTADAMLKADFGGASAEGTVSGKIYNFSVADDWEVSLKSGAIVSGVVATGMTAWKIGSHTSPDGGTYSATLYEANSRGDLVPNEVGGHFEASFEEGVGHMVGAFAASREKK